MKFQRSCLECDVKGPHCFCSLDTTALRRLDGIGTNIQVSGHQKILREGYLPDKVYVVCRGTLKLTTSSRDGRLLILRIVGPGDVLGVAAALRQSRYEATAETLEPCNLKAIPRTQYLLFMEEFQAVSRNSALAVAREYESAVLSARRLALSTSAAAKLASVLVQWGQLVLAGLHDDREMGAKQPNRVAFHMPLTHEELGHMAGISRETATRVLSRFRRTGLVSISGSQMVLPDLRRIEEQVG